VPESHPNRKIWINGELVAWRDATVHLLSHSLQRGSLVFDYMSVHRTPRGVAVFRMPEHVARLFESCELVGLPLEYCAEEVSAAIRETVLANPGARSVKVSAYLPSIEVDVVPQDDRVSLAVAAYDAQTDIIDHNRGSFPRRATVRLWIEKTFRNRREDVVPAHAKVAANYVSPMTAKWKARRAGYDEVLLIDEDGFVAEGPTTNIFIVDANGSIRTPPEEHVLLGVTRSSVLEMAKRDGFDVREEKIHPEELFEASEVFLTGTTAGVWPVESIDDRKVGASAPGPVARQLQAHFKKIVAGEDDDYLDWLTVVEPSSDRQGNSQTTSEA